MWSGRLAKASKSAWGLTESEFDGPGIHVCLIIKMFNRHSKSFTSKALLAVKQLNSERALQVLLTRPIVQMQSNAHGTDVAVRESQAGSDPPNWDWVSGSVDERVLLQVWSRALVSTPWEKALVFTPWEKALVSTHGYILSEMLKIEDSTPIGNRSISLIWLNQSVYATYLCPIDSY